MAFAGEQSEAITTHQIVTSVLILCHRKQCTNQQVYEHYITTLAEKICVLLHKIGVNGNTLHPYSIVK